MLRRRFLAGAAAMAGMGVRSARAIASPKATVLRFGYTGTSGSAIGAGAAAFAASVAKSCAGRVRVELYPAGEAGGEVEMVQDLCAGALEIVSPSSAGYVIVAPQLGVFDIPFLFRDVAHARGLLDSSAGQKALASFEPAGLVGLAWAENGLRHVTANKAVRTPQDLAGLKIRVPQSPIMVAGFKALGADVQPLPFPELYAALASGQFQAEENPLATIKDSRFDRVQKYLCLTGHVYSPTVFLISKSAYDALSPQDAQAMRDAALVAAKSARDFNDKADVSATNDLRERGMTIITDIDRAAFAAGVAGAQAEFEQRFGKDQINAIRTWKA